MEDYLIANGYNWDGSTSGNKVAKSLASKTVWHSNSDEGTVGNDQISNNKTGFTGLPGGRRLSGDGAFFSGVFDGFWWSATERSNDDANELYLSYNNVNVLIGFNSKSSGFSVRCMRD